MAVILLPGNANPSDVLAPKKFSAGANFNETGTIPSKSAATYTPSNVAQTITSGQYLSGNQTISAVTFDTSKVLTGTTIANSAGTMPNNGSQTATLNITGSAKPTKTVPSGFTSGGTITAQLDSSLAASIINTASIGGVQGTYVPYLVTVNSTPSGSDLTIFSDETYYCPPTSSDESGAVKYVDKTINFKGSARISFLVGRLTYAAIFKNGVRITDWSGNMDDNSSTTYSFIISNLNINNRIQIYAYTKPSTQYTTAINRLEGIWFNISPMVT